MTVDLVESNMNLKSKVARVEASRFSCDATSYQILLGQRDKKKEALEQVIRLLEKRSQQVDSIARELVLKKIEEHENALMDLLLEPLPAPPRRADFDQEMDSDQEIGSELDQSYSSIEQEEP